MPQASVHVIIRHWGLWDDLRDYFLVENVTSRHDVEFRLSDFDLHLCYEAFLPVPHGHFLHTFISPFL
jgi:hypothetical protein